MPFAAPPAHNCRSPSARTSTHQRWLTFVFLFMSVLSLPAMFLNFGGRRVSEDEVDILRSVYLSLGNYGGLNGMLYRSRSVQQSTHAHPSAAKSHIVPANCRQHHNSYGAGVVHVRYAVLSFCCNSATYPQSHPLAHFAQQNRGHHHHRVRLCILSGLSCLPHVSHRLQYLNSLPPPHPSNPPRTVPQTADTLPRRSTALCDSTSWSTSLPPTTLCACKVKC